MTEREAVDLELHERLRRFQVVCRIAIMTKRAGFFNIKTDDRFCITDCGVEIFGLNRYQVRLCMARELAIYDNHQLVTKVTILPS